MQRHVLVTVQRDVGREGSIHRAVAKALNAEHFDVVPTTTARGGLNACVALEPACVITELELGEPDGLWLVSAIRGQTRRIASTPILLLCSAQHPSAGPGAEPDTQVEALRRGVDVIVTKPFKVIELVAQIRALVGMASRVRARARDSLVPLAELPRGTRRPRGAFAGDLTRMSAPSVLTALELEGRSGELRLADPGDFVPLRLFLASGALVGAQLGTMHLSPLDAIVEAMRWQGRTFEFIPSRPAPAPAQSESIGRLALLAIQIEDYRSELRAEAADSGEPEHRDGSSPDATGPKRRISGTRRKVLTPVVQIPPVRSIDAPARTQPDGVPQGPAAHRLHGRRLLETMRGSEAFGDPTERRSDPRAEPDDEDTTGRRETA
jgi:two-component system, OmpR family, response regulator